MGAQNPLVIICYVVLQRLLKGTIQVCLLFSPLFCLMVLTSEACAGRQVRDAGGGGGLRGEGNGTCSSVQSVHLLQVYKHLCTHMCVRVYSLEAHYRYFFLDLLMHWSAAPRSLAACMLATLLLQVC